MLQIVALSQVIICVRRELVNMLNPFSSVGQDFQSTVETLTFLPGEGSQRHCACVQILQDSEDDDDEMFYAILNTTSPNVMVIRDTATVTIVDDDSGKNGSDKHNLCDENY